MTSATSNLEPSATRRSAGESPVLRQGTTLDTYPRGVELSRDLDFEQLSDGMGRVDLHAISGARFWATATLVVHRAILSLWVADGVGAAAISVHICAFLHFASKDIVSFYFILSGFTMTWGYVSRDLEDSAVRNRFWLRRLARFYPDFFLGTTGAWFLNLPWVFGCSAFSLWNTLYNVGSLLLVTCWFKIAVPGSQDANGPAWFMVTLVWLWLIFPFIRGPVSGFFSGDATQFWVKLSVLWALTIGMWGCLNGSLFFHEDEELSGTNNISNLQWSLKMIPLLRLPEFVFGMAIAVRVNDDRGGAYTAVGRAGWAGATVGALPGMAIFAAITYWLLRTIFRPVGCTCLDYRFWECFGWQDLIETRLAPLTAAVIYGIASCEVAANKGKVGGAEEAASGGDEGGASPGVLEDEEEAAVMAAHGEWGVDALRLLRVQPLCDIGNWGLQLFLYQAASHALFEGTLATLRLGIYSRCEKQPMSLAYAAFYAVGHVVVTYSIAWLMTPGGPVGRHVHSWAGGLVPK
jgi:peptidoglycan/LPS O-acetylase OafA/YrhL